MDDEDAAATLSAHLRADERLVWAGRPDPTSRFTTGDIFFVPFSVLWFGFAIFWCIGATIQGGAIGLFGTPFLVLGAYMAVGRFVYKARRHRATRYGLTDKRAIVIRSRELSDSPVRSTAVSVKRSRDGEHVSVQFGHASGWPGAMLYANTGMEALAWASTLPLAFYDVADVDGLTTSLDAVRSGD